MASIWSGLAAGLGTASNLMLQRQQQEWEAKLKEQERANEEARELRMHEKKLAIEAKNRAGQPLYKPEAEIGDTDYRGLAYGPDGRTVEMRSFGRRPQGILDQETLMAEQNAADRERRIRLDEARIGAAERRARGGSGGGGGSSNSKGILTAGQKRDAENQFINEYLQSKGLFQKGGNGPWFAEQPVMENQSVQTDDGTTSIGWVTGETSDEGKRVPGGYVNQLRNEARAVFRGESPQKPESKENPSPENPLSSMSREQTIDAAMKEARDAGRNLTREQVTQILKNNGYIN